MAALWWLVPVGLLLGFFGTLIGAGGGFLLVPLLLLMYPRESPETITSISLAVVFFNAASGSWAYARMGRIDYRAAFLFTLATVPGAILGALTTSSMPRRLFEVTLGSLMIALAIHLLREPAGSVPPSVYGAGRSPQPVAGSGRRATDGRSREQTQPGVHPRSPNERVTVGSGYSGQRSRTRLGMLLSVGVGYASSLLGIGGGIVHVPLLVRVLGFPVHVATATSHLVLATMALAGTCVHVATGAFHHGWRRTLALGLGVVIGSQLGAHFSNRIHGRWIIRALALALGLVGVRILLSHQ